MDEAIYRSCTEALWRWSRWTIKERRIMIHTRSERWKSAASGGKQKWGGEKRERSMAAMRGRWGVKETEEGCWHREEPRDGEAAEGEGGLLKTREAKGQRGGEREERNEKRTFSREEWKIMTLTHKRRLVKYLTITVNNLLIIDVRSFPFGYQM